jgi:hypothetical protein
MGAFIRAITKKTADMFPSHAFLAADLVLSIRQLCAPNAISSAGEFGRLVSTLTKAMAN